MKEEKLYTSEDLNLQSLSARLLITPHQLSSILNDSFSKNFNSFTNSFRIREAKRLLLQNPEKTILEIAFLVGFNSTSSFYTFFFRDTGVSPGAYRKKMIPDL
jgi:AraC-like DNA-binding protein